MNRSERRRQEKLAQKQQNAGTGQGPINDLLAQGVAHHQKGELPQAEAKYQAILKINPQHGDANHLLGLLAQQVGKFDIAKQLIEKALLANPNHPQYLNNMGGILRETGDLEGARSHHLLATQADPSFFHAFNSLGVAEKALGNFEAAQEAYEKALELKPQFPEALSNLGNLLTDMGDAEKGLKYIEQCLKLTPKSINVLYNRAVSLQSLEDFESAKLQYLEVLQLKPNFAQAANNLGMIFRLQGDIASAADYGQKAIEVDPQNAEYYYNLGLALSTAGEFSDALSCFEATTTLQPNHERAYNDTGLVYFTMGQPTRAITNHLKALEINPELEGAHNNLGNAYLERGDLLEAKDALLKEIELFSDNSNTHSNLASLYKDLGEFGKAQEHFEEALKLDPDFLMAYSNMLFAMNYDPSKSGEDIFEWYKKFNSHFASPLKAEWSPHDNETDPDRKLRIGYVAPSFCKHSTSYHLPPVFEHANKDEFEVYAYADMRVNDQFTAQYQAHSDHWIKTNGMSDEALAERIRADKIDILIDIAGHTKGNRLLTFARRPAPVALHWLDFGYTTGMDAIDYYLGDENVTPARDDHLFGEREVWRLDGPSVVYRPGPDMGEVSSLPAKENGFVTFCTLSRTVRLNEKTVKVWAEILKRVEGSKLRLDSRNYQDEMMCDLVAKRFAQFGIERDRLIMGFNSPPWDTLREIDIALDCFPHNSGTTLFEHLYMGNPYVTLYNRASVGTLGSAILRHSGFGEWVAQTEEEYVEIAVNLASDLDKLAETRASMREKMQNSPAMDEKAFVKRMENAYRQMWKQYCEAT